VADATGDAHLQAFDALRAAGGVDGLWDPQESDHQGSPKNDPRDPQENDHGARGNLTLGAAEI
jgi:hypothetical protein